METRFGAPWATSLKLVSALGIIVIFSASRAVLVADGPPWVALLAAGLLIGAALFTIRGYTIGPRGVLVHRLFWSTRLPIEGLRAAALGPDQLRWSIRVFGNGGLFSFSGWFYNKNLGFYRAFATDPKRAVILEYAHRRIVVTPDEPKRFIEELELVTNTA